jgi:hypothetical protein
VPTEGVEPTHPYGYQILSLARLPIPPRRHVETQYISAPDEVNQFQRLVVRGELILAGPGPGE